MTCRRRSERIETLKKSLLGASVVASNPIEQAKLIQGVASNKSILQFMAQGEALPAQRLHSLKIP